MKERPILFSAPMVRALLAGTKTQTRRVVNPQFGANAFPAEMGATNEWGHQIAGHSGMWWCDAEGNHEKAIRCPYGQPGDRLWVRETFQYRGASYEGGPLEDSEWFRCYGLGGPADNWDPDYPQGWEPSMHMNVRKLVEPDEQEDEGVTGWVTKRIPGIHMPRWASRITLEVTAVRVERLQDISEADAIAEGIEPCEDGIGWKRGPIAGDYPNTATRTGFQKLAYQSLWELINGPGSWKLNPWVWVVDFRRLA